MLGGDVDNGEFGDDHRFEDGEIERVVVRSGECQLNLEEPVRLGDQAFPCAGLICLDAGEVLLAIVLCRDELPAVAGRLRVLVHEILIGDPVEGTRIVNRRGISERAESQRQGGEALLAIHHEVGRECRGRRGRREDEAANEVARRYIHRARTGKTQFVLGQDVSPQLCVIPLLPCIRPLEQRHPELLRSTHQLLKRRFRDTHLISPDIGTPGARGFRQRLCPRLRPRHCHLTTPCPSNESSQQATRRASPARS